MKKIISISLAFILLLSNAGFAVATHYCGGQAVKSSIVLGNAMIDCGMKMDKECESKETIGIQISKTPCCQNEYQSLDVEDDYKQSVLRSNVNIEFIAAFINSFILTPLFADSNESEYANYSPPFLESDIPTLHQVFLL
ncbi:MAG: hypothetical protein OCD76_01585 [Reichenbachiella sp.]